jgi:hypothetical protein
MLLRFAAKPTFDLPLNVTALLLIAATTVKSPGRPPRTGES